jgi:hypothetical protein
MKTLKEMVNQGKKVKFVRYQNNELWYSTECGFEFPISQEDTVGATFVAEDKALLFMRWIKKHVDTINSAKQELV